MAHDVPVEPQDQLRTLLQLKETAVPSELPFLEAMQRTFEAQLRQKPDQAEAPTTPDTLRARIARLSNTLHQRQYELADPTLGEPWLRWGEAEVERLRRRIDEVQHDLHILDPTGSAAPMPAPDEERLRLVDELEQRYADVQEAEMLHDLHAAWMERQGHGDDLAARRRLEALRHRVAQARQDFDAAQRCIDQNVAARSGG